MSLLCPIKVRGEFHWNLLEIKKDEYGIHVSLYDTDGCPKLLDESLKCQLTQSFTSELTFEYTTTKKWFNPGQKGVNCGLIVTLMAHQLRLRSGSPLGLDFNTYAGIDTQTLSDQGIRNKVSDVVTEYCGQDDRQLLCKTRPTRNWVRKLFELGGHNICL